MIKKSYINPTTEVVLINTVSTMLAGSESLPVNNDEEVNDEKDVLSRPYNVNVWEDEEEEEEF